MLKKATTAGFQPSVLVTAIVVVTALYFGREVFIPIAAAIMLSFMSAPFVERLERRGLGRVSSVLAVVCLGLVLVGGISFVFVRQVYDVAYSLPEYKENIASRAEFFGGNQDGVLARVTSAIKEIQDRMASGPRPKKPPAPNLEATGNDLVAHQLATIIPLKPVPVEISQPITLNDIANTFLGAFVGPLGTVSTVVVLVIFMLLKREDLRNRFISIVGGRRLHVTTQAIDDAAKRIGRYLIMQLLVNSIYGAVIAAGLFAIGVPNAILWGIMATVLRFVPFIGPFFAAAVPLGISLLVFEGWVQPGLVLVLYIANEVFSGMVVEPWLFGSSTGLSAIGMLVATAFWTWLWGPVGMVLATPLTVCLSVMGRHVPQLEPLNTLLGEDDVLPPHSRYYQRLLANDAEEAVEVAEEFLAAHTLEALYEQVLVPALSLAERDWSSRSLDDTKRALVLQTTRDIIEELGDRERHAEPATVAIGGTQLIAAKVLCLPARSEADEIVGLMLAQLLQRRNIDSEVASCKTLSGEVISRIETEAVQVVCVSSLRPARTTFARYICKRLKRRFPNLRLAVGVWQPVPLSKKVAGRITASGADNILVSIEAAVRELEVAAKSSALTQTVPLTVAA